MRTAVLTFAILASFVSLAFAQEAAPAGPPPGNVGVMPVKGTNLTQGERDAIGALIASAYSGQTQGRVFGPDETGPVLAQAGTEKDAATQLNLYEYIVVTAVKLDQRIAIDATIYNRHGSHLYQTRATAMSLDDTQAVSERIAISLHRRTELEHTQTLDNVTEKEAKRPTRTFAENVAGFRTGVVIPIVADHEPAPMLLGQFDLRLEGQNYFIEFAVGLMLPSDFDDAEDKVSIGGLVGQLGASYYLTHTSVSPYVGAGLSPRLIGGDYSGAALTVGGQFGVMFMRQASTRIYIEGRFDQNVLPLSTDLSGYYDANGNYTEPDNDDVFPQEFSIAAGIGW
jgi:hypothetical protein